MSAEAATPVASATDSSPAVEKTDKPAETVQDTSTAPAIEETKPAVSEPVQDTSTDPATEETKPAVSETAQDASTTPALPEPSPAPEKVDDNTAEAPAASPSTPLQQLFAELPSITSEAGYQEMWGISLSNDSDVPTSIVLEKFLRANVEKDGKKNVAKAKAQLIEALKWRKKMDPVKLLAQTEFSSAKFGGLGYVTVYPQEGKGKEIVTWNIYGAVKDNKDTFGNVEE